ncbi:hypothetical protein KC571_02125 [candidate division WWE3 bacterium]|uniref:Uncharacterized protein n=1 Tax=candidate division WWE3 bacterium TaxID=2053526 RepID=A0A955RP92_UNCKA|nr:hypothetical protein [candidate division WWE3 bacterium]
MKKFAIIPLIVIIVVSLISIPYHTVPIELRIGSYSLWTSQYALGLRNDNPPGAFYTISPFDDLVIYKDGSEEKIIDSETLKIDESNTPRVSILGYVTRLFNDTTTLSTKSIAAKYSNNNDRNLSYKMENLGNTVAITRKITVPSKKEIIGVGQSIIFNAGDQIFLDDVLITKSETVKHEGKYLTQSGVSQITIRNDQFNSYISIKTNTSDTVVVDPELRLLTIKTFLQEPKVKSTDTSQIIEIHQ